MVAGVGPADRVPARLPPGGGGEGGVIAVGVLDHVDRADGTGDHELIEVQPDLADVVAGPADGEAAGGDVVPGAGEVGVVDRHRPPAANWDLYQL